MYVFCMCCVCVYSVLVGPHGQLDVNTVTTQSNTNFTEAQSSHCRVQDRLDHRENSQLDHRENKAYTLVTKEFISVHSNCYEN